MLFHPAGGERGALTIPESDCDAVRRDLGLDCYWTDSSVRTRTPPRVHATCPHLPEPSSVFCGGPCGDCTSVNAGDMNLVDVPCLGRNDDRELGICGLVVLATEGCSPDVPASGLCLPPDVMSIDWPVTGCSCLSFRRDTGFDRAGWVVPAHNCTRYRALYPGEVECYDDTWTPLP